MKTMQTDIDIRHYDLIKIFFEANGLFSLGFKLEIGEDTYEQPFSFTTAIGSDKPAITFTMTQTRKSLQYVYDENNDEQVSKLMLMSIRHLGFLNMLHDYLNKCGISMHKL